MINESPTGVARRRRRIGHVAASVPVMLHVIQRGDGAGAVGQPRELGDVLDPLTVQPDFSRLFFQAGKILSPRFERS